MRDKIEQRLGTVAEKHIVRVLAAFRPIDKPNAHLAYDDRERFAQSEALGVRVNAKHKAFDVIETGVQCVADEGEPALLIVVLDVTPAGRNAEHRVDRQARLDQGACV